MMPIGNINAFFIIALIIFLSVIGTAILFIFLIYGLWHSNLASLFIAHKVKLIVFITIVTILDSFTLYMMYGFHNIKVDVTREAENRKARQQFTLTEDRQYGELLLPKGTQIERYDPYDNGEENRAFRLTGLRYAEFPYPVKIANLWATAMEVGVISKLKLARDQEISGIVCKANEIAEFDVPSIYYDPVKEFNKEEPDGAEARFKPGQWIFLKCSTISRESFGPSLKEPD